MPAGIESWRKPVVLLKTRTRRFRPAAAAPVQAAHDPSLPTVQREGEEEEEVQAAHDDSLGPVQRQEAEEEEEQA